jgi:Zn-dependent M16 (insulinase) family peptidase
LNQTLHGFRVVHVEPVPDFDLIALCLVHEKTGAKYLHIARDDDNNLFSVAFPTFPKDSTGVAHILEHTTLCGSEKYPIRDPFFKMLNRSLSTFMNAWTASDYTMVRMYYLEYLEHNQCTFENIFILFIVVYCCLLLFIVVVLV